VDLTPLQMLIAASAVMIGTVVQSSVGFGLAVLSAPIVLWIDPRFVPGPMILCAFVLTLLIAFRERAALDLRGVGWAVAGRVPGTGLGILVLLWASKDLLEALIAGLILLAVVLAASGLRIAPRAGTLFGAGVVSGVMGTVASVGGPAVAIVYQHAPGPTLRGTLAGYCIFSSTISITALALSGLFGRQELIGACVLLPGVLVGFVLSRWTRTLLDDGYTRIGVLVLSALAALGVMARSLG